MAEAAVEFLLGNLKDLLVEQYKLIRDVKDEVQGLQKHLQIFNAFLKDLTKKRYKNETLKRLVSDIRDKVYDIEDAIDAFITQEADKKAKGYFTGVFHPLTQLSDVAEQVKIISNEVMKRMDEDGINTFTLHQIASATTDKLEHIKVPTVREDNLVGMEDEAETLIKYLKEETEELDVISIIGLPGLGKTTLAGKVFRDPKIQFEFPTRIWVYVSQEFRKRDVFLGIISNFTKITDEMRLKTDQELGQSVRKHLDKGQFLIVMIDVWSAEAWTDLQEAFPKTLQTGKILITSRNEEVARKANRNRDPHRPRFLTMDESWLLLQLKVFGKPGCPQDLEEHGKRIVKQCRGLPLAIVVIGGILVKKDLSGDMYARIKTWRRVSERVARYLEEEPERHMENIISLSYNKLPYYLRPCFLYLGMFPEDFEIPVWKLIRLWIAEGFIQEKPKITLEETAEEYLEDLISRNLVMVDKMSPEGNIKTCRIHDMLRKFCLNKAGIEEENLLQEIRSPAVGVFEPSDIKKFRRLGIHSNVMSFISSRPFGPRVRSFVCFSKEELSLLPENISSIPAAFKLLRILEAKSITFTKYTSDLTKLVHLRYIVLSSRFTVIPEAISNLWNLQTLVVHTTSANLTIKADIWKMIRLRHVKTSASTVLPKIGKSKEGKVLQTLGTISPQSCTEDVFDRLYSLKKLGIRGRLETLLEAKGLVKLGNLEKLKLVNDVFPTLASHGKLSRLPQHYIFPPKLRSLTLCATYLEWSHMSALGLLTALEVLKLKDNAFVGATWEAEAGGFHYLGVLHIERTNLKTWKASANHFPRLRCLVLWNCEELEEIPFSLCESLQKLDLKRSKSAVASARKIEQEKKQKQGQESSSRRSGFKLCIAPADEDELSTP